MITEVKQHLVVLVLGWVTIRRIKQFAPGEARTHGLQIMRLTRCLLRYGGTVSETQGIGRPVKKFALPTGGLEPPIFGLGDRRLIH